MQQVLSSTHLQSIQSHTLPVPKQNKAHLFTRFISWCNGQEDKRFLWLAIALMGNIGMVLPLTLLAVLFASGNNFVLWVLTCVANVPVLAINLAAQPTKVTLPFLFTAWLVNAVIVMVSLAMLLMR